MSFFFRLPPHGVDFLARLGYQRGRVGADLGEIGIRLDGQVVEVERRAAGAEWGSVVRMMVAMRCYENQAAEAGLLDFLRMRCAMAAICRLRVVHVAQAKRPGIIELFSPAFGFAGLQCPQHALDQRRRRSDQSGVRQRGISRANDGRNRLIV